MNLQIFIRSSLQLNLRTLFITTGQFILISSVLTWNIEHEKILKIADQVNADAGQVVSKTLAQNDFVSVTLFAFAKGEEIGTHDSIGDAMVTVIEGTGKFVVDGKEYILNQGETLVMPAKKPHSVHAVEAFKMMLVVIFPLEQD